MRIDRRQAQVLCVSPCLGLKKDLKKSGDRSRRRQWWSMMIKRELALELARACQGSNIEDGYGRTVIVSGRRGR
jgi:hypothetical protein